MHKIFAKNKLINAILSFSVFIFIITCFYIYKQNDAISSISTPPVNGRVGVIQQAGTCGCGTQPPCLYGCVCSTNSVGLIPSGVGPIGFCPSPAMPTTTLIPITMQSTGKSILGTCPTLFPVAVCPYIGLSKL